MKIERLIGILSILLQKDNVTTPYLQSILKLQGGQLTEISKNYAGQGFLYTKQGQGGGISFQDKVELLEPKEIREELKRNIDNMRKKYM